MLIKTERQIHEGSKAGQFIGPGRVSFGLFLMLAGCLSMLLLTGCFGNKRTKLSGGRIAEWVEFASGEETLSGTLTLPEGAGPHPAVILISGSGPQDRNGGMRILPGYRPFQEIADVLSMRGMAVLRFDDRGYMKSTGNFLKTDADDYFEDAESALDYLLTREEIDARRIGLLGHSEGAVIAAQVAGERSDVSFVISLAGPAVDGKSLLLKQTERMNAAAGMTEKELSKSLEAQEQVFDLILAGEWEQLKDLIEEVTLKSLLNMPASQRNSMGDLEALARRKASDNIEAYRNARYPYLLAHDNAADWSKVKVPILALYGALDLQCDAIQNLTAMKETCKSSGNRMLRTVVLQEANHLFLKARTGRPDEYRDLEMTLIPDLTEEIVIWLRGMRIL